MRHFVTGLGLVTAAMLASAAPATAQNQQASPPARTDSSAQERQICMRVQGAGSRITRRICRTESEWQARGELVNDPRL